MKTTNTSNNLFILNVVVIVLTVVISLSYILTELKIKHDTNINKNVTECEKKNGKLIRLYGHPDICINKEVVIQ